MKELTVISGKGGTGKTTITAALAGLADKTVLADCDVDAPDLHLILKPDVREEILFYGMKLAKRDAGKCTMCGLCIEHCRFDAISDGYDILADRCEGCGVCEFVCPVDAIELVKRVSGTTYISDTRFGPMVHAVLNTAEEASGMLVTMVRNNAKKVAEELGYGLVINDGPPGTGCPVISSIVGVDLVLVVTEPSISGIKDMERVLDVADHFDITSAVVVNKYDINLENTDTIVSYCEKKGVEVIGKLPYDEVATHSMIAEKTIIEYSDSEIGRKISDVWNILEKRLNRR